MKDKTKIPMFVAYQKGLNSMAAIRLADRYDGVFNLPYASDIKRHVAGLIDRAGVTRCQPARGG